MRHHVAFAAALITLVAPALAQGPVRPSVELAPEARERLAELEGRIDAAFATGDFVGLAVAVVKGGDTVFMKTWGSRDTETGAPVTPQTTFRIASLSKAFAATLAAEAMIEGARSPETPVAPFAPGLVMAGGAEAKLTLADVLSHRTGLPPNAYDNLLEDGLSPTAIYPKYRGVKLICPVGDCYAYQNIHYDIAGRAISSVYGAPYETLVEERLFAPLAMTTASLGRSGLYETGDFALPHKRDRLSKAPDIYGPWRAIEVKEPYYRTPAAGGVNASITDMAQWLKAQMGHAPDVLSDDVLDLIHAPRVVTPAENVRMRPVWTRFRGAQYGLGWRIYAYEGAHLIAHAGTVDGYAAQIAFLPEQDAGIVILANARSRRMFRIMPTFLDIELGLPREDWLALEDSGAPKAGAQ